MIKLLLVDDHAILREGLHSRFSKCEGIEIVDEAGTAEELRELLPNVVPDVILMDIKLPDGNGMILTQMIKKDYPSYKVIILTMYDHVRYALQALNAGADGFVLKGSPFEELLYAVHAVYNNNTYVSEAMSSKLLSRMTKDNTSPLEQLSDREFEALTLLCSGLSNNDAADRMGVTSQTLNTYRARLMKKLDLNNNVDLIRFALEKGLLQ